MKQKYFEIAEHYESCLKQFGDNHKGVDWPNIEDANKRYKIMLDIINKEDECSLLDFGCGASHLFEYIKKNNFSRINYNGLDISEEFITLSKRKYPTNNYYCLDLLQEHESLPEFDYIIMNGVFTEKVTLSFDEMWDFFQKMVEILYSKAKKGIAFNVMTKQVDWERDDLFHVSFDKMASFIIKKLTRNFIFRNDYGLYEYTIYIIK